MSTINYLVHPMATNAQKMSFNINDLNNVKRGAGTGDHYYWTRGRNSHHFCNKRKALTVCAVVVTVLAIIALCVVSAMLISQQTHNKSLQDEIAALKAPKNEAEFFQSRISTCEKELQKINHLLKSCETKCDLEKANISNHFLFEIQNIRADKETLEQNLSDCQGQKMTLDNQKSVLESEKSTQWERLDSCNREKGNLWDRVEQLSRKFNGNQCPPCSSSTVYYQSDNNSIKLIIALFALLLSRVLYGE